MVEASPPARDAHDPERARRFWSEAAPTYDRTISVSERLLFGGGREWACSRARGNVLEVAAGTGRNFPHWPADVVLTVTDFSEDMLTIARRRAAGVGRRADIRPADAGDLGFGDASFDTVVCTLGLCSVPDERAAIGEMARVLRPGGRLVLVEHVRSPSPTVRAVQRALDGPSTRWCCDHLLRDPLDHVGDFGLEVEQLERSKLGLVERLQARRTA